MENLGLFAVDVAVAVLLGVAGKASAQYVSEGLKNRFIKSLFNMNWQKWRRNIRIFLLIVASEYQYFTKLQQAKTPYLFIL